MELIEAVKTIRKELLIKDEPLKAYNLLKELNIPELSREQEINYEMVKHMFEKDAYDKSYGNGGEDPLLDAEYIEPRSLIRHAENQYYRYRWIVDEFSVNKPNTYLDLACYVGSLVTTGASRGIKSCGVDITKRAIEIAKERAKSEGLECEFYCEDIMKFNSFKADMVSAFEVIEHVVDPVEFINHLLDLSNGWVYITTPDGPFGNGEGNMAGWNIPSYRGHVRVFTKESLRDLLEGCGCEIDHLDNNHGDALIWAKFRRGK